MSNIHMKGRGWSNHTPSYTYYSSTKEAADKKKNGSFY